MVGTALDTGHVVVQALLIVFAFYGLVVALGDIINRFRLRKKGWKPFVSILLITHNNERQIEGIARWLLNFNYCDENGQLRYELVVADAQSYDNTYAILERLAREKDFLQLVRVREGQSAYEEGLAMCQGEVICLLDLKKRKVESTVGQMVTQLLG
ncbi:MAG: glycosyltransferase family 2 protein [bacterium]|jgi:cellulose synthase/poly-beta-1,6-N-acetylglucosamine synthase-like glycosyltransferase